MLNSSEMSNPNELQQTKVSIRKYDSFIADEASNDEISKGEKSIDKGTPLTTGNLIPKFVKNEQSSALTVGFSQNDEYIALGLANGTIKVYQPQTGALVSSLAYPNANDESYNIPCTSLSFRNVVNSDKKAKNVLIAGYANGAVIHWHVTSGQKLQMNIEENNQINSLSYNQLGNHYCTAGSDCHVRVYDDETTNLLYDVFAGKDGYTSGHSNKIFSVKFHPKDSNVLVSAGWDNTVQIWDCRVKYSVRSFYGPHTCGDSMDINNEGDYILTGAYSKENSLQIWDYKTCKLFEDIIWSSSTKRRSMLYTARFSHASNPSYIYAGGCNSNEARVFSLKTKKCLGLAYGFEKPVYCLAMSKDEKTLALVDGDKHFYCYDIDPSYFTDEKEEIKEANDTETGSHYYDNKH
ncbi:WD40 repeat-like protein [Neocallimastix lanati (nom. inval.)]|jgi:WD40 repeat protein|uniref:WD40 repeat-like protein n=1 Tax=Neocallimastix californiae TaxID=1754190 RepID=A0A1Y2EQQ0_9FUNG|nr:WD40 repeat-like protein [Neocallimastix sp. JGI-2020a]ORY73496.1 WD40 repeat-like protein [Neocallimastix californiae]|eukprot:ORY73496.1 WD40 repeat-like protein [Neocallimastix californiae]